ncbi:hypothetical protein ACFCV3_25165 [Kribbella sp. NPDC056345]|uniref:hypothetical protein n=1 Tax=Kribbella sp. NPDC056345 TaxID=3345789 RepID=UPI0035DECD54
MEHVETAQNPAVPSSTATPLQAGRAQAGAPRSTAAPLRAGAQPGASRSTGAEHRARAEWLVGELRRMAAGTDNPTERANLRRSADSLIRLATAYRP